MASFATRDVAVVAADVAIEGGSKLSSRISWGAVFAGAFIAVVIGMLINLLGVGLGGVTIDTSGGSTPSAEAFTAGAAIWLIAATIIALGIGGFIAGRLSGAANSEDGLCHGLTVWAVTVLMGVLVALSVALAGVAGSAIGGANAIGIVAAQAVPAATSNQGPDIAKLAMQAAAGGDVNTMTPEELDAEIGRMTAQRLARGSWTPDERNYVAAIIGKRENVPPQTAIERVNAVEKTIADAEQQAMAAADTAAHAAGLASFWAFGALLVGAIAAAAGAIFGVRNRLAFGR